MLWAMKAQRKRTRTPSALAQAQRDRQRKRDDSTKDTRTRKTRSHIAQGTSDTMRVAAVAAALTASREHPTGHAAMQAAEAVLGTPIHHSTLSRWVADYGNRALAAMPNGPTDKDIVLASHDDTLARLTTIRNLYADNLVRPEVVAEARARDSAVVMGISQDHINKATGIPAEYMTAHERIIKYCELLHMDAVQALHDFANILASQLTTVADVLTRPALSAGDSSAAQGQAQEPGGVSLTKE